MLAPLQDTFLALEEEVSHRYPERKDTPVYTCVCVFCHFTVSKTRLYMRVCVSSAISQYLKHHPFPSRFQPFYHLCRPPLPPSKVAKGRIHAYGVSMSSFLTSQNLNSEGKGKRLKWGCSWLVGLMWGVGCLSLL